jgi:non-specific serine/threonine protein kinase
LAALAGPAEYGEDSAGLVEDGLRITDLGAEGLGDPLLDRRARAEYHARLCELRAEQAEAERNNDPGRAARLREEADVLTAQLTAALQPSGGARRHASPAERARVNVRNSIVTALRVIGKHDDALRRHLANSIKTGTFCVYAPEDDLPWQL